MVSEVDPLNSCPYCNEIMEKVPKRKSKCPKCQNELYVRSKQKLFQRILLTKQEAIAVDQMKNLTMYGINEEMYFEMSGELSKHSQQKVNPVDIVLRIMDNIIINALNNGNLNTLKMIYYSKALLLNETGQNCYHSLRESARISLMILQKHGLKRVKILNNNSCNICQQFTDKIYSISEILDNMPIPCPNCQTILFKGSSGFCRCIYLPITEYELGGEI